MIDASQKKQVQSRLNKIAGQIQGVKKMLDEDRYCIDILNQTSAIQSALRRVEEIVMKQHLHTCVTDALRSGDPDNQKMKIEEVMKVVAQIRH